MKEKLLKFSVIAILLVIAITYYSNKKSEISLHDAQQQNNYMLELKKLENESIVREEEKKEETRNKLNLILCLDGAKNMYWDYVKLNGVLIDESKSIYEADSSVWDKAENKQERAEDRCFKLYN